MVQILQPFNKPIRARKPREKKLNTFIFNPGAGPHYGDGTILPMIWPLLKTYHDYNGESGSDWNWIPPLVSDYSVNTSFDYIKDTPIHVLGLSTYVWNVKPCYELARRIKEIYPNCLVVAGGPQAEYKWYPDYFQKYPFIDLVIPFEGEIAFSKILDKVAAEDKNFTGLDGVVMPGPGRQGHLISGSRIDQNVTEWKHSAILDNEGILLDMVKTWRDSGSNHPGINLETIRGCPYQCVFCDWGGGTYTKIRKRPLDMVKEEIEWSAKNGIYFMDLVDANFGIIPRDIEVMEYIGECQDKYGFPKKLNVRVAKNSKERVHEIYKMLAKHKFVHYYKTSVQSMDDQVSKNIKRKDIPWDDQIPIALDLMRNHGLYSRVEIITGLPGDTFDLYFKGICKIYEHKLFVRRANPFQILPNAPAADPDYIKEWKIKWNTGPNELYAYRVRKGYEKYFDDRYISFVVDPEDEKAWFVKECSTFTPEDLCQMMASHNLLIALHELGITGVLIAYFNSELGVSLQDFYLDLYNNFFGNPRRSGRFHQYHEDVLSTFRDWLDSKGVFEIKVSDDPEFPIRISSDCYYAYQILLHREEFYDLLKVYLEERYSEFFQKKRMNKIFQDAFHYQRECMIGFDYDYRVGKKIECLWDWQSCVRKYRDPLYEGENKILETPRIPRGSFYYTDEAEVVLRNETEKLDWHVFSPDDELNKRLTFFFRLLPGINNTGDRFFQKLEIIDTNK
jgi:putative methyltransferase